jgi:hypothetical protein
MGENESLVNQSRRIIVGRNTRTGCGAIAAFLILLFSVMGKAVAYGQTGKIAVGRNVCVSGAMSKEPHYEVVLAADPKNPDYLLSGSMVYSNERSEFYVIGYASFDRGRTWTPTLKIPQETHRFGWDPACAFGPEGNAYFVSQGMTAEGRSNALIWRSRDGGKTWEKPTEIITGIERSFVVADKTNSKYRGRVYICAAGAGSSIDKDRFLPGITILHSKDGAVSLESPVTLFSTGNRYPSLPGNSVVLSDGTMVCLFDELREFFREDGSSAIPEAKPSDPNARLKIVTSSDGGENFSKATVVSDLYLPWDWASLSLPTLAVDETSIPFKDRLYVTWPDIRSGRLEILFSYSADKGKSWSGPVVINDERPPADPGTGPNHFMSIVAVNRDGVVGVSWYDRREAVGNLDWSVRFTSSLDGGDTFLPSVKVSEAPFSHSESVPLPINTAGSGGGDVVPWRRGNSLKLTVGVHRFYFSGGHTAGLTADAGGTFHALWVDNRTGVPQVWTAPITVEGTALRNGARELSDLEDISDKVMLEYSNTRFDRDTGILSLEARLVNTSTETITVPIKARVTLLRSDLAVAKLLTTDNGQSGPGAVWDFSSLVKDNTLKPKERSGQKPLKFHLTDLRAVRPGTESITALVRVESRILGRMHIPIKTAIAPSVVSLREAINTKR